MTQIVAVRSAFPAHRYPQADLTRAIAALAGLDADAPRTDLVAGSGGAGRAGSSRQRALLERLHANAGVDARHTVFPLEEYGALGADANDRYVEEATALGERALQAALAQAGIDRKSVV